MVLSFQIRVCVKIISAAWDKDGHGRTDSVCFIVACSAAIADIAIRADAGDIAARARGPEPVAAVFAAMSNAPGGGKVRGLAASFRIASEIFKGLLTAQQIYTGTGAILPGRFGRVFGVRRSDNLILNNHRFLIWRKRKKMKLAVKPLNESAVLPERIAVFRMKGNGFYSVTADNKCETPFIPEHQPFHGSPCDFFFMAITIQIAAKSDHISLSERSFQRLSAGNCHFCHHDSVNLL
jgi:hypothetical protein